VWSAGGGKIREVEKKNPNQSPAISLAKIFMSNQQEHDSSRETVPLWDLFD